MTRRKQGEKIIRRVVYSIQKTRQHLFTPLEDRRPGRLERLLKYKAGMYAEIEAAKQRTQFLSGPAAEHVRQEYERASAYDLTGKRPHTIIIDERV